MNKIIILLILILLTSSCTEESKSEKYFVNCVKDGIKTRKYTEDKSVHECQALKNIFPDKFKYYKGKIFSKKR